MIEYAASQDTYGLAKVLSFLEGDFRLYSSKLIAIYNLYKGLDAFKL